MNVLLLLLTAVIAYPLGSVNGSILSARWLFRRDVRTMGSGNAGLTNYYRSFGAVGVVPVFAIDVLKTMLAVLLGGLLLSSQDATETGRLFAGFCALLGHVFPLWHQFRGGKGVLSGVTMLFLVDWRVGLCCMVVFVVTVIFTRYVSLGSILAAALAPLLMLAFDHPSLSGILTALCALLVLLRHATNILRLIGGTERRLQFSSRSKRDEEDFR